MITLEQAKEILQKNKKRLQQELLESKETLLLIKKSTHSKLTESEKKQIKEQVLDICKSIPAFAVFMLPGGAILLPLLVKLIPDILPSAFKDDADVK